MYFINRNKTDLYVTTGYESIYHDHGSFGRGILPVADLILLQNGDIIVGSEQSTFSYMIANVVGVNGLKKGINSSPIYFWERPYLIAPEKYRNLPGCLI